MHNKTFYQDDLHINGEHFRVTAEKRPGCYRLHVGTIADDKPIRGFDAYSDSVHTLHYEAIMAGLESYPLDVRFAARAGIALLQIAALRIELGMADADQ